MNHKYIIVNADDCGMSQVVNNHIEQAILLGKISSTTVMANMDDFKGAVNLYKKYSSLISFGWHINLSEGTPLLKSQVLLDTGYYFERDGTIFFNGKDFYKKSLTREMKEDIKQELKAQFYKLCDHGIRVSHADSHHHLHVSRSLMFLVPSLLEELGVDKMRRMRNYVPYSLDFMARKTVGITMSVLFPRIKHTDTFGYFKEYYDNPHLPQGQTIELECHPGHPKYDEEEKLLFDNDLTELLGVKLVSYNFL